MTGTSASMPPQPRGVVWETCMFPARLPTTVGHRSEASRDVIALSPATRSSENWLVVFIGLISSPSLEAHDDHVAQLGVRIAERGVDAERIVGDERGLRVERAELRSRAGRAG